MLSGNRPPDRFKFVRQNYYSVETALACHRTESNRVHYAENRTDSPMTNAWLALLIAGLMELTWPLGLKYSDGFTKLWPTLGTAAAIVLSFVLLEQAIRQIPFGTAYAIWTGIGAAGAMLIGMILSEERADLVRVICLMMIVIGCVGLKFATEPH
jgi:quaternary ammonium compound-resistance protein SugE